MFGVVHINTKLVEPVHLSPWVNKICLFSSIIATLIILGNILGHLKNYRKPMEQRLMIRIQWIVPLFALSCYSMLVNQTSVFNKFILEPIREVYEAFVIYTFFSLLTHMLGGERNIIIMTSGRRPVSHPGFMGYIMRPMDISDPYTFLGIKRGILQYVWLKPIICISIIVAELVGWYNVNDMSIKSVYLWLTVMYNFSVTLSLYCLAMFWKILFDDLKPFKPVGKFLCVKLIIFASYWQGVLLAILNAFQILPGGSEAAENGSIGICIQNALLCVELIAFGIGHWFSFSYKPFTISQLPNGRLRFKFAFKDMIGIRDLLHDFQLTFYGDYYKDYKQFDSVGALIAHPESNGRMGRINQGLRYHFDGKHKHWLPSQSPPTIHPSNTRTTAETQAVSMNISPSLQAQGSEYSPSLKSTGTSTRGLYSSSPKLLASPPPSPVVSATTMENSNSKKSICDTLMNDPLLSTIDYDKELFDEDEMFYKKATSVINSYNLDQTEIKRLLNYPIVDEMIDGHVFGYKVSKLRQNRLKNNGELNESLKSRSNINESGRYGSIV